MPKEFTPTSAIPIPTNVSKLRTLLGITSYYRKFVANYAMTAEPLYRLLRKDIPFVWTSAHDAAFNILKKALVAAPVLAHPDFKLTPLDVVSELC